MRAGLARVVAEALGFAALGFAGAVAVAAWRDLDVRRAVAYALLAAAAALVLLSGPAPSARRPPHFRGLERDYVRHAHVAETPPRHPPFVEAIARLTLAGGVAALGVLILLADA